MVSRVCCMTISGIEVYPVMVETDTGNGLPGFEMVGSISADVRESRERVRTALKNSGFAIPPRRITINFSPADIRKNGTHFDLAVAVSVLAGTELISKFDEKAFYIGELSLNGEVLSVNGVLPMVLYAMKCGAKTCYIPEDNISECEFIDGIKVIGVSSISELLVKMEQGDYGRRKTPARIIHAKEPEIDFSEIAGQKMAKRAAVIAAAGMHNILLVGPPGSGKSSIAKAMPGILPALNEEEAIEISSVQSIAGLLDNGLVSTRPFRQVHHSVTTPALVGGGFNPRPGEITLASGGILFMDEFPEFSRSCLEMLRQPLEDEKIVISRAGATYTYPAKILLVAAMNPCRCGYFPDRNRCSCTQRDVEKYREKISGPILDRIDICVKVDEVPFESIGKREKETSEDIKERVNTAAKIQSERYRDVGINFNSRLRGGDIEKFCPLGDRERKFLGKAYEKLGMSVRSCNKVITTARTIADLDERKDIEVSDLAEAIQYRTKLK